MPDEAEIKAFEDAKKSLERIQNFDVNTLPRSDDLGKSLSFIDAVEPASRIISTYKKIAVSALEDFPIEYLQKIKKSADGDYNLFISILNFNPDQIQTPAPERQSILANLKDRYQQLFKEMYHFISYSMHKLTDFENLEARARSTLQTIRDDTEQIQNDLNLKNEEAKSILETVKNVAAEQGVSQQAIYFKEESEKYEQEAFKWFKYVIGSAILLLAYAIATFYLNKIDYFRPLDKYDTIQFVTSKVILFGVLSFGLYFSAKNYFSSKHNAIINKHRQNALLTYRSIAEAAKSGANSDVILNHASSCIFSPQSTGFFSQSASGTASSSVVELMAKPFIEK